MLRFINFVTISCSLAFCIKSTYKSKRREVEENLLKIMIDILFNLIGVSWLVCCPLNLVVSEKFSDTELDIEEGSKVIISQPKMGSRRASFNVSHPTPPQTHIHLPHKRQSIKSDMVLSKLSIRKLMTSNDEMTMWYIVRFSAVIEQRLLFR